MKKNRKLFVMSLALLLLLSPAAFAQAIDVNENQDRINENQDRINKNQEKINERQAKINEEQDDVNESENKNSQVNGASHRSAVATFVQNLLDVADREKGGIGEQVKAIAQQQNDSKDNVANEIDKIKKRSGFKTFLFGTDYKNIGQLRSAMVTTGNQIDQLKKLLDKTTDPTNKTTLQSEIDALTLEQQKINDFVKTNESKFSLLGWFVKLF
ncbi:MAG: hypothetical protein ABIS26_01025, partial [Candidatus Paceibacterota bacterium]